jgi:hypothetical protein
MQRLLAGFIHCLTGVQVLALLFALAKPAYAYVDPGSGLFALQVISTTFAGMIFILRRRLQTILRKMTLRSRSEREKASE